MQPIFYVMLLYERSLFEFQIYLRATVFVKSTMMSGRRLDYKSSMNRTNYDDMSSWSMDSLRARRAELEAKRRQLEALDRQRLRDAKSLSSAHHVTLKRARATLERQSEMASQRNKKLSLAYNSLIRKHDEVIEDSGYLSRALARYQVCHAG